MFSLYFAMKLFAAVGAAVLMGLIMIPLATLLAVIGWLTAMVGGVLILTDPASGIITLATGVGMIALGIWLQRRDVRIATEGAEETSRRISRMMRVDLPVVEEEADSDWQVVPPQDLPNDASSKAPRSQNVGRREKS